jgi:hypothetical protein
MMKPIIVLSFCILGVFVSLNANAFEVRVTYSFTYERTGVDKYDDFFETVKKTSDDLDEASFIIENIVPVCKQAVKDALAAVKQSTDVSGNLSDIMNKLKAGLASAHLDVNIEITEESITLTVTPDTDADIKPEVMTKIETAIASINDALGLIASIPDTARAIADDSVSLVEQGNDLVGSAKTDFTGFNALKLPGCLSTLNKAIGVASKFPEKADGVAKSAGSMIEGLGKLSGGKNEEG